MIMIIMISIDAYTVDAYCATTHVVRSNEENLITKTKREIDRYSKPASSRFLASLEAAC